MNHRDDYFIHLSNLLKNTEFKEELPSVELLYTVFSLEQAIEDMSFLQNIMGVNVNTDFLKQNISPLYLPDFNNRIFLKYIFKEKEIDNEDIIYIYLGKEKLSDTHRIIDRSSSDFYNHLERSILKKALSLAGFKDKDSHAQSYIDSYLSNMVGFQWSFDESPYHHEIEKEILEEKRRFSGDITSALDPYNSLFYKNFPRNKEINDFNKREFSKAYAIIKELLEEEIEALSKNKELLNLNKEGRVIVSDIAFENKKTWEKLQFNIKEEHRKIHSDINFFYLHYLYSVLKEKFNNLGASINFEGFKEENGELLLDISFSEYRTTISHSNYYLYLLTNSIPPKMDYSDPLASMQIKNWIKERKFFKEWKKDLLSFLSILENKNNGTSCFSMGISFALMFKQEKGYVSLIRQQRKHANVIEAYNLMPSTIYQTGSYFYQLMKERSLDQTEVPFLMKDIQINHFLLRELIREIFLGGGLREFQFNIPSYNRDLNKDPSFIRERDYSDYKVKELELYQRFMNSLEISAPLKIIGIALDPLRLRPEIMVMVPIDDDEILEDLKKFEFSTKADFINLNEREIRYLSLDLDCDFEEVLVENGLPGRADAKNYSGSSISTLEKSFNLLKKEGGSHEQ